MPVTDLTFLNSFAGGNREKVAKYVNLFLKHAPAMVGTMEHHLASNDFAALKTAAHALKPQITYMGIKTGEDLIRKIEHDAEAGISVDDLTGQINQLKSLLDKAYPELQSAIEGS